MRRKLLLTTSGLHPYTRRILKRAKQESFTLPSTPTIKAMDKMIRRLVAENLWDKFDIHYWAAYNDVNVFDFTRIDWKVPNLRLMNAAAVNYTVNGWKFDSNVGFNTQFRFLDTIAGSLNDAHKAAIVFDSSQAVNATTGIISGNQTNGIDRWSAFNTNFQQINANTFVASAINMSGTGYKTINRTSSTDVILTSGISTFTTTGNSNTLAAYNEFINANSSSYGRLGLCNFSAGGAINDKYMLLRSIYNEFLVSIGLTGFA